MGRLLRAIMGGSMAYLIMAVCMCSHIARYDRVLSSCHASTVSTGDQGTRWRRPSGTFHYCTVLTIVQHLYFPPPRLYDFGAHSLTCAPSFSRSHFGPVGIKVHQLVCFGYHEIISAALTRLSLSHLPSSVALSDVAKSLSHLTVSLQQRSLWLSPLLPSPSPTSQSLSNSARTHSLCYCPVFLPPRSLCPTALAVGLSPLFVPARYRPRSHIHPLENIKQESVPLPRRMLSLASPELRV